MAVTNQDVQKLYIAYFNRPADFFGLQFQVNAANTTSLAAVANGFANSPEFLETYAGKTDAQFVNALYVNLFGREADLPGLSFWINLLNTKFVTKGTIALEMLKGAINQDLVTVNNKVAAATAFYAAIDTVPEATAYAGTQANLVAKQWLAGITDNASLAAAIAQPALDATLSAVVLAGTPAPIVTTFLLTAGIDTVPGGAGNDVINSTVTGGLSPLDVINGGAGANSLNVSDINAIAISSAVTVTNIQTASLTSGGTVSGNTTGWTGLTKLTVAETGGNAAGITAAATTAVSVSDVAQGAGGFIVNGGSSVTLTTVGGTAAGTTAVTGAAGAVTITQSSDAATAGHTTGTVSVTGGTTVSVKENYLGTVNTTVTGGAITVNGGAATTTVSVDQTAAQTASATKTGVADAAVTINDVNTASTTKAGTITSVEASNYTTLSINDNALTTLNLTGGSGNITIANGNLTTPTNKALAVTVNGLTGGSLIDAGVYKTLNITTATTKSTLANISQAAVTALAVDGTKGLTLTSTAGLAALKTVTVSGAAGLTADLSTSGTVTSVDTSATTGASAITVNAATTTFTGGAGADSVTVATGATKVISLGAGNDTLTLGAIAPTVAIGGGADSDTLSIDATAAGTASGSATFAGLVTGFENLTLTGATNQTIDLAVLGNYINATTSGGNGLTLNNFVNGGALVLNGAGTAYTIANSAFIAGASDLVNLTLTDGSGAGVAFATTGITVASVEAFAITTVDSQTTPSGTFMDSVTLLNNSAKTITVGGNAGLNLTATDTALTSLDASGITLGDFTFTSGALTAAASIKGSATGINTVDFSAATKAVTYIGGSGVDTVTASNGKANIITLGDGANVVTATTGNNTITGGVNADSVTVTTGNNTVSLGNGANSFTATSGNNTYVGGTGVDTVNVGGGVNMITTGTGADIVTFGAMTANGNSYSTIADAHAGMKIAFNDAGLISGTATFTTAKITLADTAVFQDFLDAGTAGAGTATNSNISWFQFNGNTYIVEDNSAATTYQNAGDSVVKLVGLVDLSTATFAAVAATSGTLTLV